MGRGSEQTFFQRRYISGQQVHEKLFNITSPQGNANSNNEVSLYVSKNSYYQNDKTQQMLGGCRAKGTLGIVVRLQIGIDMLENNIEDPKQIKIVSYDTAISILRK